nr:hypothetical protein L203_06640 [Cryptococcus depauperatus CBS 7841]
MATQHPAQAFASHLINQTLSSIALLESLSVVSPADASLIRQKLPSPTGPFPSLSSSSPSSSFANLNIVQSSPTPSWTVQHAREDTVHTSVNHGQHPPPMGQAAPALPPRQRSGLVEQRGKALWDFNGTEAEDLQFRSGDIIIVDEEVNEQWSRGRVVPAGHNAPLPRLGLFPSNYIEKIPLHQSQNPPSQASYYQAPPPGPHTMVPYQPPPQGYYDQKQHMQMMQPHQQVQGGVMMQQQEPQKNKFGKIGSQLGTAAVTGVGFGAGSAVGSGIINSIF